MSRGLALFLGLFTLLNLLGDSRFDVNLWWIDLSPLPHGIAVIVLIAFVIAMSTLALGTRNGVTTTLTIAMLIFAIANSIRYYVLRARGDIASRFPLPMSLVIAVALAVILSRPERSRRGEGPVPRLAAFVISAILFPLAQISLFGFTDYRRPADLIVVFGASGRPLYERVRTACELYRQGLANHVLFSGGPGEPELMRNYAMQRGVPASAIIEDPAGINTEASVRNTVAMSHGRILAVSHFYHLPRIKMTFQRYGAEVYTVPSEASMFGLLPYQLAREDAAFWTYYLRRFKTSPQSAAR